MPASEMHGAELGQTNMPESEISKISGHDEFTASIKESLRIISGRKKFSAINAFRHIEAAYRILDTDPAMAAFRAITAEEEAASSVYIALREKGYKDAKKINFRKHDHKAALFHLVRCISDAMYECKFPIPHVSIKKDVPRIDVRFRAADFFGNDDDRWVEISDPLHFQISDGHHVLTFADRLNKLATKEGKSGIIDMVKYEANLRNSLLYASEAGFPEVSIKRKFIDERLRRVKILCCLMIIINQTDEKQLFAEQCLGILSSVIFEMSAFNVQKIPFAEGIVVERLDSGVTIYGWERRIKAYYLLRAWIPSRIYLGDAKMPRNGRI